MKIEDTILGKKIKLGIEPKQSFDKKGLTLYDPVTQLCKRIESFFKADPDITCRYVVNNSKHLGPKIDPDTGEQMTKKMIIDGEEIEVYLESDHLSEMRIFCKDYEKAQCLSNVIRHRHLIEETYQGAYEDDYIHYRAHYLIVHVCVVEAVDPDGSQGGINPWSTDDDTDQGVKEIFGLEPIDWDDPESSGCNDRLAPSDISESDIPKGYPDEYEQKQWEGSLGSAVWKWKWFKNALKGNKNIMGKTYEFNDGMNIWRFLECSYVPVVIPEDNLTSINGFNSILPADLIPLIFSIFGEFQIATYARKES